MSLSSMFRSVAGGSALAISCALLGAAAGAGVNVAGQVLTEDRRMNPFPGQQQVHWQEAEPLAKIGAVLFGIAGLVLTPPRKRKEVLSDHPAP